VAEQMDILEYSSKRDNLRVELCAMVAGHVDWLAKQTRTADHGKFFVDGIIEEVARYRERVAALNAEYGINQGEAQSPLSR
jgi:hypothetical protein